MKTMMNRRTFLRTTGLSAALLPFLGGLPSLQAASVAGGNRQRIIFMFSPNGTIPKDFWPDVTDSGLKLKRILSPLEAWKDKMIVLRGLADQVRGDGDNHMRGMSCLLTGTELYPGNIQGGSHTPAGWAKGISIDQELKNFLQANPATRTRFGSLELGVAVPNRADPWTRWSYAGPNQPVAPIDDPYQLFNKLYGNTKDRALVGSVLDTVSADLKRAAQAASVEDRTLLENHLAFVREMEREIQDEKKQSAAKSPPKLEEGVALENDNIPRIARMQIDMMVKAFENDMARVASLQFMNSVSGARMKWIGVDDGHHSLSHEPDSNAVAAEKLVKINIWFAEQLALLTKRLAETPEPGGEGSMLDHTTIVWTNELGKGNSHTLDDVPFVLLGGGLGFKTGRVVKYDKQVAHNRLWLSVAHAFGHPIKTFGSPNFCGAGPLSLG